MVELVSVPFPVCFDTNNLLKNRITSGMHIYSSPRKHVSKTWVLYPQSMSNTRFLTVYTLGRSGTVRTAFLFLRSLPPGFFFFSHLCYKFDFFIINSLEF